MAGAFAEYRNVGFDERVLNSRKGKCLIEYIDRLLKMQLLIDFNSIGFKSFFKVAYLTATINLGGNADLYASTG